MKKSLLMVGLLVLVGLGFQSGVSGVKAETAKPQDETLLIQLMERTTTTKMLFEGGTANWSVSYKVMDTVVPNKNERKTQTLFDLAPLTQDQNYANKRKFKYIARHSQGWLGGEQWVKTGERISLVSNAPAPRAIRN